VWVFTEKLSFSNFSQDLGCGFARDQWWHCGAGIKHYILDAYFLSQTADRLPISYQSLNFVEKSEYEKWDA